VNGRSTAQREDEVGVRLLHTADWHLGKRFKAFGRDHERKLTRARLEVVDQIFALAESRRVHAIVCAGDQFDGPSPAEEWWRGLLECLKARDFAQRPLVLLPGNHDPLTSRSVYHDHHPFRAGLPAGVHVVDRDGWELEIAGGAAVICASPCTSEAGETGLVGTLPAREPGDERVRVGLVHGQTFELAGVETHFPIDLAAAGTKGLDYLALGDTHGFCVVQERPVTAVYPGAPEATRFDEQEPGHVALAFLPGGGRPPIVQKQKVGRWSWRRVECRSLDALCDFCERPGPAPSVVRLVLDMAVRLAERDELERLLKTLAGTEAAYGRVAVLDVDATRLRDAPELGAAEFPSELPSVLARTVERLQQKMAEGTDGDRPRRALYQLWRLVHQRERGSGP
jgi:hypothetical protein